VIISRNVAIPVFNRMDPFALGTLTAGFPAGRERAGSLLLATNKQARLSMVLAMVVLLTFANPVLANWWIVRAADGKCLAVDVEPSGHDVAKVGKDVYQTREQAEAAVKILCRDDQLPRTLRNTE
jgi:hypothetical protein